MKGIYYLANYLFKKWLLKILPCINNLEKEKIPNTGVLGLIFFFSDFDSGI